MSFGFSFFRFDSELSKVQEEMRTEKSVGERLQREKDELVSNFQNFNTFHFLFQKL